MSGRDFPRPWLERRSTPRSRLFVLVVVSIAIVVGVFLLDDSTAEDVPSPRVTVGTSGPATPYEPAP